MDYVAVRVVLGSEPLAGFKGEYTALNADTLPRSGFVQDLLCGARDYAEQSPQRADWTAKLRKLLGII
jgi:hypothetical protein